MYNKCLQLLYHILILRARILKGREALSGFFLPSITPDEKSVKKVAFLAGMWYINPARLLHTLARFRRGGPSNGGRGRKQPPAEGKKPKGGKE